MSKILGTMTVLGTAFTTGGAVDLVSGESTSTDASSECSVEKAKNTSVDVIEMTDDELAIAIEEYDAMYEKYNSLKEETLSTIPTIIEEVTMHNDIEYSYLLSYNIDNIDFTVIYNDLGNTPSYGVGNLEGIVVVNDGINDEIILTMNGALVQDYFDGDKLHIDSVDSLGNYFEVTYKIDDFGIKYDYSYLVNDIAGSMNIKTKNHDNGEEFSIKVLQDDYTNSYKYRSKVEDDTESITAEYTVEGSSTTVKVSVTEDSPDYIFYDGLLKDHKKDNKHEKGGHHAKH